jgi:hypothetical protein
LQASVNSLLVNVVQKDIESRKGGHMGNAVSHLSSAYDSNFFYAHCTFRFRSTGQSTS